MHLNLGGFVAFLHTLSLVESSSIPIPLAYSPAGFPSNRVSFTPLVSEDDLGYTSFPSLRDSELPLARPTLDLNPVTTTEASRRTDTTCDVEPYNVPPPSNLTFPAFDPAQAIVYRYRQQQSVNLGSWFVQEQWMVPSLFLCAAGSQISELDVASGWNSTVAARATLERHWDTFVNQSDFDYLASIGINTVRLPIGYWSLGSDYCQGTPFSAVADVYENAWSRIVRAIIMAAEAGIGVLVDLHGAVGSQNGQPHSGISDGQTRLFNDTSNMNKTIDVLLFLVEQLVNVTNVVGVEILNEPQNVPQLTDFYTRAITQMRQISPEAAAFPLYVHDGFDLDRFSEYIANRTDFVVQDHHSYFVYTPSDEVESASEHSDDIKSSIYSSLANASLGERRNLVVDEWSCALTPASLSHEKDPESARKTFCTNQLDVYTNTSAGWGFWSYLKEDCSNDQGWCFKSAVGNVLPSTFFSYGELINSTQLRSLASTISSLNLPFPANILSRGSESSSRRRSSRFSHLIRRESDTMILAPTEFAYSRGYSDGFLTGEIFASFGMSRLGFIEQYIDDGLGVLGRTVIGAGSEESYREGFQQGLQDAESIIRSAVLSGG